MCRSLRVLCAAPGGERLAELKLATVSARWELVGGATSTHELADQLERWQPDVIVLDSDLGPAAVARCRATRPGARLIVVGAGEASEMADAAAGQDGVREVIIGIPWPGGPVGTQSH